MSPPVLIIGGGPAGMALALALYRGGVASTIIDARPHGAAQGDARILALSHGSRLSLEMLGVWKDIPHTRITTIHVSHQGGLGRTLLRAEEEDVPALGYVLTAGDLAAALDQALAATGIAYQDKATAPVHTDALLTVHAEGRVEDAGTDIRTHDYGQHAVICTARATVPHGNIAWERFTPAGPVALLPCKDQYAVVLTCSAEDSTRIAAMDDAEFIKLLQERFGPRVTLVGVTPRHLYPLGLRVRGHPVGDRAVWIGNAAQTLHPVAGQGFNLALRDIMDLADTLTDAVDPGDSALLGRYAARRRLDRAGTVGFTDGLVRLFSNTIPPLLHARGAGLFVLDLVPPARSFLARRMMFGARGW